MKAHCMNRIIIRYMFKTRMCMNFHYDVMLKTTEINNAMRWWKTLKAMPSIQWRTVGVMKQLLRPSQQSRSPYHYHLTIDGRTVVLSLSVRILPCMDLRPCTHLFPVLFSLLYDLSTDYYHNPPFQLNKWMSMESALPTCWKCDWLVTLMLVRWNGVAVMFSMKIVSIARLKWNFIYVQFDG